MTRETIFNKALEGKEVILVPTGNNVARGDDAGSPMDQATKGFIVKVAKVFVTINVGGNSGYERKLRINDCLPNYASSNNSGYEFFLSDEAFEGEKLLLKVERALRDVNLTQEQAAGIAQVMGWVEPKEVEAQADDWATPNETFDKLSAVNSDTIPKHFWHGDDQPIVDDVAGLTAVLSTLPPALKFPSPVQVIVYNAKTKPTVEVVETC